MFRRKVHPVIAHARQERRDFERRRNREQQIPALALLGVSLFIMVLYIIMIVGYAAGF